MSAVSHNRSQTYHLSVIRTICQLYCDYICTSSHHCTYSQTNKYETKDLYQATNLIKIIFPYVSLLYLFNILTYFIKNLKQTTLNVYTVLNLFCLYLIITYLSSLQKFKQSIFYIFFENFSGKNY